MAPREMVRPTESGRATTPGDVLGGGEGARPALASETPGVSDSATVTPATARRPTVISSVPGTVYRATSPIRLRGRVDAPPREVDAPGRRKR
jgi:hypothetical protein